MLQLCSVVNFIDRRINFLYDIFISQETYCTVVLEYDSDISPNTVIHKNGVKYSETFNDLPDIYREGYEFEGWFYKNSNRQFNYTLPVIENITLTARWKAMNDDTISRKDKSSIITLLANNKTRLVVFVSVGSLVLVFMIMIYIESKRCQIRNIKVVKQK